MQFSHATTTKAVRRLLVAHGSPREIDIRRRELHGHPVITDNGNYLLDVALNRADDVAALTVELNQIPGVVENGFFVGVADEVVIGWPDGSAAAYQLPLSLPLYPPTTPSS